MWYTNNTNVFYLQHVCNSMLYIYFNITCSNRILHFKYHFRMLSRKSLGLGRLHSSSSATTVTLLVVSFYLIFSVLPVTICYVLQNYFPVGPMDITLEEISQHPTWQAHLKFRATKIIIHKITLSHFALNLFIYLLTGKLFRIQFKNLICQYCCYARFRQHHAGEHNLSVQTSNMTGS